MVSDEDLSGLNSGWWFSNWDYSRFKYDHELIEQQKEKPMVSQLNMYLTGGRKAVWVPFKYSTEGFIIRRSDKFEMLAQPDGTPIRAFNEECIKSPHKFHRKFIVCIGKSSKNSKYYYLGFNNPLLAINTAWKKPHFNRHPGPITDYDLFGEEKIYKILKPVIDLQSDDEYNNHTGAQQEEPPTLKPLVKSLQFPSADGAVEDIYQSFAQYMDDTISLGRKQVVHKWGSKSNCVGTLECVAGEQLLLRTSKRNVDFDYVTRCVKQNGFPPLVTRFPKSGSVTSQGYLRDIYPMNILYENVLRRFFGKAAPQIPYTIAKGRDYGPDLGYYYDIKSCDRALLPYIARYCVERDYKFLIPLVHDSMAGDQLAYHVNTFPSGVFHTSIVTVCFTAAVCQHLGVKDAVIQGDGFMCSSELHHELLRRDDSFNGFRYSPCGVWYYTRGENINKFKYLRGAGPRGLMRYVITAWAYEYLGSDVTFKQVHCDAFVGDSSQQVSKCGGCGTYTYFGAHFWYLDDADKCRLINLLYSDVGSTVKVALTEKGFGYDNRGNSWDSQKLEEIPVPKHQGPLLFPRMPDPLM